MPLTHSDVKQAIQEVRKEDFEKFLKSRRPARTLEAEGERLARDRLAPAGQASRRWTVTLASAEHYPLLFTPAFWAGTGDKLKIGDTLEIRDDLLTLYATALVVVAGQTHAEIRELSKVTLAPANPDEEIRGEFQTSYEGLYRKWIVVRKTDGHIMREQLASKTDALNFINADLKPLKS